MQWFSLAQFKDYSNDHVDRSLIIFEVTRCQAPYYPGIVLARHRVTYFRPPRPFGHPS